MKLPSPRELLRIAAEQAEIGPARVGSPLADIITMWGSPEHSGQMKKGRTLHRWGGIQVTSNAANLVEGIAAVCDPRQPPMSPIARDLYGRVCDISLTDLPQSAQHIQLPHDEDERLFEAGRVQCVFQMSTGAILKILTTSV